MIESTFPDGSSLPGADEPPPTPISSKAWSPPSLREIALSNTRSGTPDDTREGGLYETKS